MSCFKHSVSQAAVVMLALLAAVSGCSPKRSSDVLARVGDSVITTEDFRQEVQWRLAHHHPLPEKSMLLEEMVARELELQKAKALGLEKDIDVRRSYEDMLVGELKDRQLAPKVESANVSAQELEAEYEHDIGKYTKPAKTRLAVIYMKVDRRMTAEQKVAVEARMAEAEKAAHALTSFARGFSAVAMDYSDDQVGRYTGGDAGWVEEGAPVFRWPKDVVQAGVGLQKIGQISPVIHTSNGLYLVMKTDFRGKSVIPLATVSASIQRRLLAEKKQELEEAFAKDLRAATTVKTDLITLSQVEYPTTTVAQVDEKLPPALPRSQ